METFLGGMLAGAVFAACCCLYGATRGRKTSPAAARMSQARCPESRRILIPSGCDVPQHKPPADALEGFRWATDASDEAAGSATEPLELFEPGPQKRDDVDPASQVVSESQEEKSPEPELTEEPYWRLQHWRIEGSRLAGYYRTKYGSFAGHIEAYDTDSPRFYITEPPPELRAHPHWCCFQRRERGRYWIHFGPAPTDPDTGILEVEKVLAESLERQRREVT